MLHNYLTVIARNLRKHRGFTLINVIGLAVGIACCLLIYLFVQLERSYDHFHVKADRTYRIVTEVNPPSGQITNIAFTSPVLAGAMIEDLPEVERAVRLFARAGVVQVGNTLNVEDLLFVDSTFFDVFSFPLLQGNPATALAAPGSVVLTPSTAEQYFGQANPLNETITFADSISLRVTGIVAEPPPNSHIRFDFLASYATLAVSRSPHWGRLNNWTYVVLAEGTPQETLGARLPDFSQRRMTNNLANVMSLHVQPLTGIYFDSDLLGEIGPTGDRTYSYVFSIIGLFVLLVAGINFTNLTTARSLQRAREVGVRKVLGARRTQLIRQFLGESTLLAFTALVLGLALAALVFPLFRDLAGIDLPVSVLFAGPMLGGLVGGTLLLGVLAGSYPALFLSAFQPTTVLKGQGAATPSGRRIRQGLVAVQFGISIVLLVGTATVTQQLRYVQNKQLGFNEEQILTVRLDNDLSQRYALLKESFLQQPDVRAAAASSSIPSNPIAPRAYVPDGLSEGNLLVNTLGIDYDFLNTLEIDLAAGRGFDRDYAADGEAFLINEAAVRQFGWGTASDALDREIAVAADGDPASWLRGPVVGVVQDFHYASLHETIQPLILRLDDAFNILSLRLQADALPATLEQIEAHWATLVPDQPFTAAFLDESLQNMYETEHRLGRLFGIFTALAIFVACLGLFGLAAFTAERRTKEIGVRKVLGATAPRLVGLLTREYIALMLIANAIAWPPAYFAMRYWLDSFAYRVEISWPIFLGAGLIALLVALLTVSYQSVKAAMKNPVNALRYE